MSLENLDLNQTINHLQQKLAKLLPPEEIRYKAELVYEINRRKKEVGAVILGHNYMEPALFIGVCDIIGDSLEISRRAAETKAQTIIFCGVRFMAETAKILNPTRTVLLPAKVAGCSLASSINANDVRNLKNRFPGAPVVTYVNTYVDVKAESDICCTSRNAANIVKALLEKGHSKIIFIPDEYLSSNVAAELNLKIYFTDRTSTGPKDLDEVETNSLIAWKGRCEVHEQFTVEDIQSVRKQYPDVAVLSHPECSPEVVKASDYSSSTTRMVDYVKNSNAGHFLILTECSMGENIIADNPDKDILRMCSVRCPHMNEITLEDTLKAINENKYKIEVPEEIRIRALTSVQRMLEVS
jgi:quinolinate synthase